MTHLIRAVLIALAGLAAPHHVTIVAYDYAFDAPDSIPPGVTVFRLGNHGTELHHFALVRLEDGHTVQELNAALGANSPTPPWATWFGGPQVAPPGMESNATIDLIPGTYAIVCLVPSADGTPHFMKGMSRQLIVSGPHTQAMLPRPTVTITLVDYAFQLSRTLSAGHEIIRIENEGTQPHEIFLARLAPGATIEDLPHWVAARQGRPPIESPMGGVTPIAPGGEIEFTVDLTPGEYGLYCFLPDANDGKSHVQHGMLMHLTVPPSAVARR